MHFSASTSARLIWLKVLIGWVLLAVSCNLPANPLISQDALTRQPAITPPPSLPLLPTLIPQAPPALVETQPLPGSTVNTSTGIVFFFNQAMDRASVERALQTEPHLAGAFDWQDDATLRFIPASAPETGVFSIRLGPPARAQNGLELAAQPDLTFRSPGQLELVEGLPADGAQQVNPAAPVVAVFNQPVTPLSAEDRSSPPAFSLEPPAPGRGEWINTSTYLFYPDPALSGATTYTVAINPALTAASGATLIPGQQGQFAWSFTTAKPRLEAVLPEHRANLLLDSSFELVFNQAMDAASVERHFALTSSAGEQVEGNFKWADGSQRLIFTPSDLLDRSSVYRLRLAAGAEAPGGTPLGVGTAIEYTTVGDLALVKRDPPAGEPVRSFFGQSDFRLEFNAPLAKESIADFFEIDPPVEDLAINLDYYNAQVVRISGTMAFSADYTLTISAGLRDAWGQPLGHALELVFITPPAKPALNAPMLWGMDRKRLLFFLPDDVQLVGEATNLTRLDIVATPLDVTQTLALFTEEGGALPQNARQVRWQQALDLHANRPHKVDIPLAQDGVSRPPGLYLIQITSPEIVLEEHEQPLEFVAVVSPVQLVIKRSPAEALVWAVDVETNQPLAGTTVRILNAAGQEIGSLVTAADGVGQAALSGDDFYQPVYAVTGAPGDPNFSFASSAWSRGIDTWDFGLPGYWDDERFGYAYTDRPVYMPGQTVHFRATVHRKINARYLPAGHEQVNVEIYGAYSAVDGETPLMAEMTLPVSEFGGITGEFLIPENAPAGAYSLRIDEAPQLYLFFTVAEYRKPEIDLQVDFQAEEYDRHAAIDASIRARYFFGAPAGGQRISWSLYAVDEPLYLPAGYQTGALNLDKAYHWYEGVGLGEVSLGDYGVTAADGSFAIHLTGADLEKLLNTGNRRRLTLEATLLSETEFPVSARATTVLNPADFVIGVRPEIYLARAGAEIGFSILTTDLSGDPSAGHTLQARFAQVSWPERDGNVRLSEPAQPEFSLVSSSDFRTGADGRARLAFIPPNPGLYQLEVVGEGAITQVLVWVGGQGTPTWPNLPDQQLLLQSDRDAYRPGDSAQILAPNPFGAGAQALVTVERASVMRAEVITVNGPSLELNIPLLPEDAPNVFLSVILIGYRADGKPDFRAGYIELQIDPQEHFLRIDLISDPLRSEPGGEVLFTLAVSDAAGNPVQGEFSLALVDKAVLALADPNAASIYEAYYGRQPLAVRSSMSLAAYNRRMNLSQDDATGRGGGPGAENPFIRTHFEDTAFWQGNIRTGPDGRAEVRARLPDNLTTWVALARGLDGDARVGEAEIEVIATKDLLVRPHTPRFLVAGDQAVLGAHVHNNTGSALTVETRLDAQGFELHDPDGAQQQIALPAGASAYVTWSGTAMQVDEIDLVFSAQAGDLHDAAAPAGGALPVVKYHAPATYGAAGTLAEAGERLEVIALPRSFTPTGGSLRIELSPSLAAAIIEELQAQRFYSSTFTETVLSSFLPNVQSRQALLALGYTIPELEADLDREIASGIAALLRMQNEDGGWGVTAGAGSNTHISAYVVFGLAHAQAAGQAVDEQALHKGRTYLLQNLVVPDASTSPDELNRLAFHNFALQQAGVQDPALENLVNFYEDMDAWAQGLLALTLAGNDPQDSRARQILMGIKDAVRRSASGVHWEQRNPSPALFCTPNFNNAVVVYTLAKLDPASPMLPDAVRYLLSARRPGGGWASSYETAWSLLAITQALRGAADVRADYAYTVTLDDQELVRGQASPTTLDPVSIEVGLDRLRPGAGNVLRLRRESGVGRLYYRAFLQLDRPVEMAEPVARGVHIERRYYLANQDCRADTCTPQDTFDVGRETQVLVRLTLTLPESMHYLVVEDFIPAGAEIVDTSLKTTQLSQGDPAYHLLNPFDLGWRSWIFGSPHIGKDRGPVVFGELADLLRRHYAQVVYARNITDIDDKINQSALEQGVPITTIT
ncbi:MAG: Ig-like domain-containing protein, partial [Anaerolineaceae bacterium]